MVELEVATMMAMAFADGGYHDPQELLTPPTRSKVGLTLKPLPPLALEHSVDQWLGIVAYLWTSELRHPWEHEW